jgi:hypothetical protein
MGKKSDALPTVHQPCIGCLDGGRNMLATSSQHCSQYVHYVGGGGRGRNMEKVFTPRCLDIGHNMLATSSQHVRHKLATLLATCTLCQGRREGAQHGKKCSQHGKSVRNIRNTLRNIMIWRPICFLIRIVWLGRCPMLAPGSDVWALAVP